ncbi:helix-turn-helix domain-containing protein [Yinghuangia sp. YIM S09857]|uniref:helix-turn-helix domain-containing protein n=1 Tax=Yinghuangia sp. YIM S09857 TaxID=3436929 RepID=UPI003F53683A
MAGGSDPIDGRLLVASELRRVRDDTGLTQSEAADQLSWSASKIARIEAGHVAVSRTDLMALLSVYAVKGQLRDSLLAANDTSRRTRTWWSRHSRVLSPALQQLLRFESQCELLRQYEPLLIPGLLQTRDYARAVIGQHTSDPGTVETLVKVRLRRQIEVCGRPAPPLLWFALDEAAVRRVVGSPELMADQLEHVLAHAEKAHVTVRVVPFDAGVHPGLRGPLALYGLRAEHGRFVVYQESWAGGMFTRDEPTVDHARTVFNRLHAIALDAEDSAVFLRDVVGEMREKAARRAEVRKEAAKERPTATLPAGWSARP